MHALTKSLAVGPDLVVSATLAWLLTCLVPAPISGAVTITVSLTTVAIVSGRGEPLAAAALLATRRARPAERDDLAPALTRLCRASLGPPVVDLRVRRADAIIATGAGRRTVVISTGLIAAVADGRMTAGQAAAVMAHAASLVRAGLVRWDLLIGLWCLPVRLIRAVASPATRVAHRPRSAVLAWRARGLVVAVAIAQAATGGHIGLAGGLLAVGVLSYATPAWRRRWTELLVQAGDAAVARAGLAVELAGFLRTCRSTPGIRTRLRALDPTRPAPALGLVRA